MIPPLLQGRLRTTQQIMFVFLYYFVLHVTLVSCQNIEKTYFIEEERPAQTQVANLREDVGPEGESYFFFIADTNYFETNSDGIIRTKVPLDYEDKQTHSLYAVAQSGGSISITVNVIDTNDNLPEFPSPVVYLDLSEAIPVGAKRSLDSAKDKDEGNYNTQGYTIVSGNVGNTFALETYRGSGPNQDLFLDLVINQQLDREVTPNFTLFIQAFDGGSPPRTGNLTLNINILDINDNPPVFTQETFAATVNETLPVGSPILQVTASDADDGPNGQVIFEINRQRDPNEYFRIDPHTGVLSLNKPLDYESQTSHSILITARDNATQPEASFAFVTIYVLNVNENPPNINILFLSDDGTPKVSEAAEEGAFIARVSVNDPDEGELTDVNVTLSGGQGHFGIVTRDNIIYLVCVHEQLDREEQSSYEIVIHSHDFGVPPLSAEKRVVISVTDINDNAPIFDQPDGYFASVFELADIGSSVFQIRATDADDGVNAALSYAIQHQPGSHSDWFQIDENSGLITTSQLIDREIAETVMLLIIASDSGIPSLSGNVSVTVTLRDVNDNQPRFEMSAYNVTIPEDISTGTCFLTVMATDADADDFGSVSYSIGQGYGTPPPSQFFIRSESGRICTASELDRDGNVKEYEFPVQVVDGGGLSSIALVKVIMTDVNDNKPIFYPSLYTVDIEEGSDIGSDIASVTAQDIDSGEFGLVFYTIVSGNEQQLFTINRQTGTITLAGTLNSDNQAMHLLEVQATDGGGQRSEQNAEVSISVVGPDDSPPVFEQSRYNFAVQENTARLQAVGTVHAENSDPENIAPVTYSIQSGDPNTYFTLNQNTGEITINMPPDHEQSPTVLLNVQAASGNPPTYGHTQVNITVIDVNDNAPEFPNTIDMIKLPESTTVGNIIYIASAHDRDSGDNGLLRYKLVENPRATFAVHRVTGQVTLERTVSYNEQSSYEVKVQAYDRGNPIMKTNLTLVVQVQDVNDNGPQFDRTGMYHVTIAESSPISHRFLHVVATDNDRGINARITYTLKQSVDAAYFAIFPDSGQLYTRQRLDHELQTEYILEVIASDNGMPPQSATAIVKVTIADDNDNIPQFTQESYHFSLPENMAPNTNVGIIEATDRDGDNNNRVTYSMPNSPHFNIDPSSGVIKTRRELDREDIASYQLTVIANDNGAPPLTSTAEVYITVEDINDNTPMFSHSDRYVVFVKEEQSVGGFVVKLLAEDPDSGDNGTIGYSIRTGGSKFSIDANTGVISTAAVLDREKHQTYTVLAVASDNGDPSMSSSIPVIVHVEDINDHTPQAENRTYLFTVEENTAPETVVGQVSAHDPDAGDNGRLYYSIIDGNSYGVFGINRTTGVIFLVNEIDYEMGANYQLTVLVEDNGSVRPQTTTIFVDIDVTDLNDNAPEFTEDPVQFGIREGIMIGQVVWTFSAHDADSAENGKVRYSILTADQSSFEVDPVSGELTTTSEIDHETKTEYLFVVQAQDQATNEEDRKSTTVTVRVFVEDENDNEPTFTSRTTTHVMEDEPVGYPVLHVVAVDGDSGENGRLIYEVVSGNDDGKFVLDSLTGLLTIAHSLDHEHQRHYNLNISASDHGIPQRVAYQALDIVVEDVNDLPPQFDPSDYEMNVTEHMPPMTFVGQVTATDGDSGNNGEVSYEIPSGIADHKFTVDSMTGIILTAAELDRETIGKYVITVYAKDGAYPARYDVATVVINVADANDHSPTFASDTYSLVLPENQAPSTLHTVVAQDEDIGINALLTYTIIGGNEKSQFQLNPTNGQLSTVGPLDREQDSRYNLTIQASDGGSPPRTATMVISVTVTDQNDNDPEFEQTSYQHMIPESTGIGSTVITVHAVDQDVGSNAEVQYSMDNATLGLFQIDAATGHITTAGTFDYEKERVYTFEVKATDGGAFGPRSEKVQVTINIADENDNAPVIASIPVRANISIGTGSGAYVTTVRAEDKDSGVNGQVHFRFGETSQEFTIVEETGVILTRVAISTDMVYRMEVVAFDLGTPSQSSKGIVEVRAGDTPSATLEFAQSNYMVNVDEGEDANHNILVLHAERSDKTPAAVNYRIASGNENNAFGIQTASDDSAILIIQDSTTLDYETDPNLRLIIEAEAPSGGPVPLYGYATININLRDANDNAPHFVQEKYTTSVWESHNAGIYVIQVSATDADSGSNSQIRYAITAGNVDAAFHLDQLTGILTTNANLDREIRDSYRLTLEAVDGGSPRLSGTAMLKISIVDTNDNRPSFPPPVTLTKSENLEVGSEIVTLTAFDADTNPSITYSFAPNGNPGRTFSIDQYSGTITLAEPLDRELTDRYEVHVIASDTVYTDQTMLTVSVQDENDNIPTFDQQSYQVTLPELTPAGYAVLTVNATDLDKDLNAEITYSMGVAPVQGFTIDPVTGAISTNQTIDFNPAQPIIQLVVTATDHGSPPLSSVVAVRIQITDINNNAPEFAQETYSAFVDENAIVGYVVTTALATDRDPSPDNQKIDYFIISGNEAGKFQISPDTGDIVVVDALDREDVPWYTLIVLASDRGIPQRNATAEVDITVRDVNDHTPIFSQVEYSATVSELALPNTTVVKVSASDADDGRNAQVRYEIKSGNDLDMFKIDAETGQITVRGILDHDTVPIVRISVRATDGSLENPLSSVVTVSINVTDENDNKPYFPVMMYLERVPENSPIDTLVFAAHAIDKDTGEYGQLTYSIADGSGKDYFSINPSTGEVRTLAIFDFESIDSYRLLIRAVDPGGQSVAVQAQVEITSRDEYAPVFDNQNYKFNIPKDAAIGTSIGQVHASDMDKGTDGIVFYTLVEPSDYIALNDTTGILTVKKSLSKSSRRKRNIDEGHYRTRRAADDISLTIKATSGRENSEEGICSAVVSAGASGGTGGLIGSSDTVKWILVIIIPILVFLLLILILLIFVIKRRRNQHEEVERKPDRSMSQQSYDGAFDPVEMGPHAMVNHGLSMTPDQHLMYAQNGLYRLPPGANSSMEVGHLTRTDISDQSNNSASSGRGSTTVEDDEIRRINERTVSPDEKNPRKVIDSGIAQDHDDGMSFRETETDFMHSHGKESLAEMMQTGGSVESMHVFGDEGGGEAGGGGVDIGNLIYAKLDEVGAEEDDAIMDGTRAFGFTDEGQPSMGGSLSSIVNSDEELSGSYNWDYLLDWGPQFHPLAHVFEEIALLKDDTVAARQTNHHRPKNMAKPKMHPPPLLTNRPQGPIKPVAPVAMNTSNMSYVLPRSPITNDSAFSPTAASPDLTPDLSPLVPGSPSVHGTPPVVITSNGYGSVHSSRRNSGSSTNSTLKSQRAIILPAFAGDEEEIQI